MADIDHFLIGPIGEAASFRDQSEYGHAFGICIFPRLMNFTKYIDWLIADKVERDLRVADIFSAEKSSKFAAQFGRGFSCRRYIADHWQPDQAFIVDDIFSREIFLAKDFDLDPIPGGKAILHNVDAWQFVGSCRRASGQASAEDESDRA